MVDHPVWHTLHDGRSEMQILQLRMQISQQDVPDRQHSAAHSGSLLLLLQLLLLGPVQAQLVLTPFVLMYLCF